MKLLSALLVLVVLLIPFFHVPSAHAIENPLSTQNNIYGIHILNEADIEDAANLVNSSGGDWGYVTLVIREDEMDKTRWQKVFDQLREKHLIPLVRIASTQGELSWEPLDSEKIDEWVDFLDSLNWVVKNRYIIVGNEPNHAKEWGGKISPTEYASYLVQFSVTAKEKSEDFFILPAGFDASAPTDAKHMSEETFLQRMINSEPEILSVIDGWTSHSYPNPNFSGETTDTGKGSIKTYEWEISFLKRNGLDRDLPIFITETGWAHDANGSNDEFVSETKVSEFMEYAFNSVWKEDSQIVAVTPFILNYSQDPFDIFSWKKPDGNFYDFYNKIKDISKSGGNPHQESEGFVTLTLLPEVLQKEDQKFGVSVVLNIGQSIWGQEETQVLINDEMYSIRPLSFVDKIRPFEKGLVYITKL